MGLWWHRFCPFEYSPCSSWEGIGCNATAGTCSHSDACGIQTAQRLAPPPRHHSSPSLPGRDAQGGVNVKNLPLETCRRDWPSSFPSVSITSARLLSTVQVRPLVCSHDECVRTTSGWKYAVDHYGDTPARNRNNYDVVLRSSPSGHHIVKHVSLHHAGNFVACQLSDLLCVKSKKKKKKRKMKVQCDRQAEMSKRLCCSFRD